MAENPDNGNSAANADDQLKLSPSERIGYTTATKLSGGAVRRSTQRALASVVLGFEMIVIFLAGLALFGLGIFEPREVGLVVGGALCLLCLIALALLRTPIGIYLGWLVQVLVFVCALWLPAIVVVGLLFGGLWVYCMVRGAKIDRDRAAWAAGHTQSGWVQ